MHTMKSVMQAIEASIKNGRTSMPILTSNQCHSLAHFLNKVEQVQGEPVAWLAKTLKGSLAGTLGLARYDQRLNPELYEGPFPVFRHADPGEVERLRENHRRHAARLIDERGRLRAQLAERDALLKEVWQASDLGHMPEAWHQRILALSASAEPGPSAKPHLCEDEGCPHHGVDHVCVTPKQRKALQVEQELGVERVPVCVACTLGDGRQHSKQCGSEQLLTFQVSAFGYEGTQDTMERLFWVRAETEAQVQEAVTASGADYHLFKGQLPQEVDFTLPTDLDPLREQLLAFNSSTTPEQRAAATLATLEPTEKTFTVFCQETTGRGTVWIDTVEAAGLEEAKNIGLERCADEWKMDLDEVRVLGVAEGEPLILHWEDIE